MRGVKTARNGNNGTMLQGWKMRHIKIREKHDKQMDGRICRSIYSAWKASFAARCKNLTLGTHTEVARIANKGTWLDTHWLLRV